MKIKYIATAKEWRDKVNGNSYFSVQVKNLENGKIIYMPYQYGYGNHFEDEVKKLLNLNGYNSSLPIEFIKIENCLKRDVIAWGLE
jgi:hypothetical protein